MVTFISPPAIPGQICFDKPILERVKFTDLKDNYEAGEIIYDKKCVVSKVFGEHDYLVCYKGIISVKADKSFPYYRGQLLMQDDKNPKYVKGISTSASTLIVRRMCGIAMSDSNLLKGEKDFFIIAMLINFGGAED